MDDSRDDTPLQLQQLAEQYTEVGYVHRENGRGLATAVTEGFRRAQGTYIIVMDADLQHPPELLPLIYRRLTEGTDIVIPSRFVEGGSDGGLNPFRKLVSWTARMVGQFSMKRLRHISDCTGGYFGLHRQVVEGVELSPIGWKILMEVLVKGQYESVHEIPYSFVARNSGESKMSMKEQWNYLRHIGRLVWSSAEDRRFYIFCFVGLLGVVVNLISLALLVGLLQIGELTASVMASFIAMLHNFVWNDRVTWKGHKHPIIWRRVLQLPQFMVVSAIGIAITAFFAQSALWLNMNVFAGQFIGILTAVAWNFTANSRWTWSKAPAKEMKPRAVIKVSRERYPSTSQTI